MTTKHTPGPWSVDDDGTIRADNGDEVFASHGAGEGHYLAATHADRLLVAAAPDLLHVALMVLRGASDGALYGFARAAIDKATGDAP